MRILTLLLLLLPLAAFADDTDALLERLKDLRSLQGEFTQRQYLQGGGEPLVSAGNFRLLRPGYFAWEVIQPDSQLVLATPEYLWHHDRDLETVTRRPVDTGGQLTPLQVLGGNAVVLRASYQVEALEAAGDFRLTPIEPEAGFRSVVLHFADEGLEGMTIIDTLGQRVEVAFSALTRNPSLTAAEFQFTPPPDADLFYHDQ